MPLVVFFFLAMQDSCYYALYSGRELPTLLDSSPLVSVAVLQFASATFRSDQTFVGHPRTRSVLSRPLTKKSISLLLARGRTIVEVKMIAQRLAYSLISCDRRPFCVSARRCQHFVLC